MSRHTIGRPWKSSRNVRGTLHARRPRFVLGYWDGDPVTLVDVAKVVVTVVFLWATLVVLFTFGTVVAS